MEDRVRELFAAVLNISAAGLDDDSRPAVIERWDSLQHLILVSSFEEEFGIDIDPDEVVDMYQDFGSFKRVVLSKAGDA